jgi:multicomponent Na+:H+ antiporter subunit D
MICGIGIGTELSLNGSAAHAFAHIIYKALLLMSAGSVLYMTGKQKCTDLGGLYRSMPLTTLCGIIGALSISAFPLTSGFISKSMISQAAANEYLAMVWFLLAAGSAGVFLHAGVKFPWFVFFQKDSGLRPSDPPLNMRMAMTLFAFLCIVLGVWPEPLYAILPFQVDYVPYTRAHVVEMLQLLLFSGLAFFIMLPYLKRTPTITLDWDWFYRGLGPRAVSQVMQVLNRWHTHRRIDFLRHLGTLFGTLFIYHGPRGILARTWATGSMVLWVVILLGVYLVAYYY